MGYNWAKIYEKIFINIIVFCNQLCYGGAKRCFKQDYGRFDE